MSGEIEVPETPNWLQELEAKRERRLKARLGHEAGAGAPCLKCGDKCPGLDLHFWRKCCKICKCAKEEHEVQDDDIYGWAQFQLLGSKPNKIKRKIALPGKKDEVELDWIPKGHNDTVDKYLKTLPPDQLPVKGSQAAQDRKQLLQKQIPIHDIDPTLCHELSADELKQMNDYIAHVKQTSVGVGQIVSLSNIIKANLHMLNPSEAALIASRYPKGIPLAEIVKLQSQNRANALKQQGLSQKLDKLSLQDPNKASRDSNKVSQDPNKMQQDPNKMQQDPNKTLPNFMPNFVSSSEENLNPWVSNNVRDVNYTGYTKDVNQPLTNLQFSGRLRPGQNRGYITSTRPDENVEILAPTLDEKFLQNPNFDPKNTPSQFMQQNPLSGQSKTSHHNIPHGENTGYNPGDATNSAFVPYNRVTSGLKPGEKYIDENPRNPSYSSNLLGRGTKSPSGFRSGEIHGQDPSRTREIGSIEDYDPLDPNFARNLSKYPGGYKNTAGDQDEYFAQPGSRNDIPFEHLEEMKKNHSRGMPNYVPGKYNVYSETLSPTKLPKNVKDLAFSTYDPTDPNSGEPRAIPSRNDALAYENYPPGQFSHETSPYKQKSTGLIPGQYAGSNLPNKSVPSGVQNQDVPKNNPYSQRIPAGELESGEYAGSGSTLGQNMPYSRFGQPNIPYDQSSGFKPGQYGEPENIPSKGFGGIPGGAQDDVYGQKAPHSHFDQSNIPYDHKPGQYGGPDSIPSTNLGGSQDGMYGQNAPHFNQANVPYDQVSGLKSGQYGGPGSAQGQNMPYSHFDQSNIPYDESSGLKPGQYGGPENIPSKGVGGIPSGSQDENAPHFDQANVPFDQASGLKSGQYGGPLKSLHPGGSQGDVHGQTLPQGQYYPSNAPSIPYGTKPTKKLSELHPGKISVNEDFLHPSQVTIGAIQDIDYPEIKAAMQGTNDFYEDYSPDSLREILNNVKLPDCHYCKKPFEENEFAITIDRANVLFHAQCFKCAGCNQILADNVYFYNKETDNVYCGRDYAKIRGFPRCKACDELIFTKEYCLAENSTFHLKHFCCIECDTPLAGQDYTLEDSMPYCLPCFEQSKASKCSSCGRVIKPDEVGCNLKGVHFHAVDECFACKVCKKPLMGKKMLLRNEKLYCSYDCFGIDSGQ